MGWWIAGIVLAILFGLFWYWQLIIAEGVYLGQNIVTLLYDWVAHKYNDIKEFDSQDEQDYLARPLSNALGVNFNGVVLDVATGTGRLPLALHRHPDFQGTVIGVDHSRRMLAQARQSLPGVPLIIADAVHLPFATNAIEAVTCLEALEFFSSPERGLQELTRVLQAGGILLATNRVGWETRLMPGKTWSADKLQSILASLPLTRVMVFPWLDIYHQVWAVKQVVTTTEME